MIFEPVTDTKVPFLIIRDLYTPEELSLINVELDFLNKSGSLLLNNTISATKYGQVLKKAQGVFLDGFYANRNASLILKFNRKLFTNRDIVTQFINLNSIYYSNYVSCNFDSTLLNYYEDTDYYKVHADDAVYSIITWIFKEPKLFTGGDLRFVDENRTINIKNNMAVIFPSFLKHEVDEIKLNKDAPHNSGRYSIAQFLQFGPKSIRTEN